MENHSSNALVRANLDHITKFGKSYQAGKSSSVHSLKTFREIMGSHSVLSNPRDRIFTSEIEPMIFDPGLASARFLYILSGSNEVDPIAFYSHGVRQFSDDGKHLHGSSYGRRLFAKNKDGESQMEHLLDVLRTQPNSTRGTLAIYSAEDCGRDSRDIPCALDFTLSPRNEVLHGTLFMRANAGLRLMPYNLFEFTMIQEWVARQCDLILGEYHHSVVSMHLRDDELSVGSTIANEEVSTPEMAHMPETSQDFHHVLLSEEERIRQEIDTWTPESASRQIEELHRKFGHYWGDLLSAVILRAFRVTHNRQDIHQLLQALSQYDEGPLLSTTRTIYEKTDRVMG